MIRLHVFHTGSVRADPAIPWNSGRKLETYGAFRSAEKKLILPVSCYLIETEKGKILIDTGWDTVYAHKRPGQMLGMADRISTPIIRDDQGIDTKLKSIGVSMQDIQAVYLSHMDFDHTSGLRLVKEVPHIYASAEEWQAARKFSFRYIDTWTGICTIEPFEFQDSSAGPFHRSLDVFGDGSVLLTFSPGHSHGLFSVIFTSGTDYVILGNDAAYTQESFEKHIIPGFIVNREQAERSLDWLITCRRDPHCRAVLVNHDPSVNEQVIDL